jgi:hypothetical protein
MRLTRKELLVAGAASAAAGAGIYELVDRLATSPTRAADAPLGPEQHVVPGLRVISDEGVEVVVPPLHHRIVTAEVRAGSSRSALLEARRELEEVLAGLERRYEPTASGLVATVGWGLPYFERYVPGPAKEHIPVDIRASHAARRKVRALTPSIRFPSDPETVILEHNDVVVLLRGDDSAAVEAGARAILGVTSLRPTSVRSGFAGGGFGGGESLPKQMAVAAGVPGAQLIPKTAELFFGFTSTQKRGLGPPRIANLETLGYTNARGGYFEGGTHLAVSHILEDLEGWYLTFDFQDRVDTTFRPGLKVPDGTQTVPQAEFQTTPEVVRAYRKTGTIGHSGAIQTTSRLTRDVRGSDGTLYPKGTAIPARADFNTLDNPFAWSAEPQRDRMSDQPAAGVHFVVFNPTSDDFKRNRLAMDGVLPGGTRLPFQQGDRGQGLNSLLVTTHRQNFLVPPRRHRSFPLVELL